MDRVRKRERALLAAARMVNTIEGGRWIE